MERLVFALIGMVLSFIAGMVTIIFCGGMAMEFAPAIVVGFMGVGTLAGAVLPTKKAAYEGPSEYDLYWNALKESDRKEAEAIRLALDAYKEHLSFDVEEEAAAHDAGMEMWCEATEDQRDAFNRIDTEKMSWSEQADRLQEILDRDDHLDTAQREAEAYEYEAYQLTHIWWKNIICGPVSTRLALFAGYTQCPACPSTNYIAPTCFDCGEGLEGL